MEWLRIDQACLYAGKCSRKTLYSAVERGMRVARLGESGRRLMFSREWIDEYFASCAPPGKREASTANSLKANDRGDSEAA